MRQRSQKEVNQRIVDVAKIAGPDRLNVMKLIEVAGLDPATDFRFENWSGISFASLDLSGFDFTGARLHGCNFKGARIAGARFDQAELGRVIHREGRDPHLPAEMTEIADLEQAADWGAVANLRNWIPPAKPCSDAHLPIGAIFSDAPGIAPEMVVVPGAPAFAIGRFAVTFAEWDAAQMHPEWRKHAGIERRVPNDFGWGHGKQPVIDVSWSDANAYCAWASAVTGKTYRLPSEAEWEQACRAGTKTEFWWGNEISTAQANYDGNHTFGNGKEGRYRKRTMPVDSFEANPWGLYQVHGNVWEWCEDAYYASSRVVRGGSWSSSPGNLRSSYPDRHGPASRFSRLGFRVARVLSPSRTLAAPMQVRTTLYPHAD